MLVSGSVREVRLGTLRLTFAFRIPITPSMHGMRSREEDNPGPAGPSLLRTSPVLAVVRPGFLRGKLDWLPPGKQEAGRPAPCLSFVVSLTSPSQRAPRPTGLSGLAGCPEQAGYGWPGIHCNAATRSGRSF